MAKAADPKSTLSKGSNVAQRVYWIGLELALNGTRRYIEKYQKQLSVSLTESQLACVQAVLAAIVSCLQTLPVHTKEE